MSDQEIYEEVKRFGELTEEKIDEVAARLREMSPKFEDMIRPEIIEMAGIHRRGGKNRN